MREIYKLIKDLKVTGITSDSRKVVPGSLFVAYQGVGTDGHKYIQQAIDKGAVAVRRGVILQL